MYNLPINKTVLKDLQCLHKERAYCYRGNELLFTKDSGINPDKIHFTHEEMKIVKDKVDVIIHNHCNNSSLSIHDFLLAALNNVKTIVAISEHYIWRIDLELPFLDAVEVLNFVVLTYDDLKLSMGKPLFNHIAWSIISGKYSSIKYEAIQLEV
jgi:hypothetical protein